MELVIVTGMSGAGRRSVLSALEDAGCTALDNVPARLLEPLLELEAKLNPSRPRLAVGMDNRHPEFADELPPLVERLLDGSIPVYVVFVEADDETLLRRYSESRRPHFLAREGSLLEAIHREREMLSPVRGMATAIIDTSNLTLSQMRKRIADLLPDLPVEGTTLRLISFGFKHGVPQESDMILDARFLPNPHYVAELKALTGKDSAVKDFLLKSDLFGTFLALAENWVQWAWPYIQQEGRAYHTISIGCTGGQHRSVALVEMLAQRLRRDIPKLVVTHRELNGD
ncbi:RNase adapter RapZ [Mesoterricola sediminis]|uniref:Nucleotide-binding protein n=1 Tax=Mesoterricola sediminis TaxID=2927980 RepID=A0AA48GTH3_9BACT|nr:RNase adapter RapZ [Mesoterricola sediminis]BDU75899.1 nucleotide-binding protein [Mesoterricola sediminis]